MTTQLPITTTSPEGQPLANSKDVASYFGKRHDNVLRDVDALLTASSDLRGHMYQEVRLYDQRANRETRSFDMTKDGFTLVVMGYTGAQAPQVQPSKSFIAPLTFNNACLPKNFIKIVSILTQRSASGISRKAPRTTRGSLNQKRV